jgi:predicted metal-binding protein
MRSIVFCTTCRHSDGNKTNAQGVTGGEALAREMESFLAEKGRKDILVDRHECLWSCTQHCNVLLRDTEKFSYLTGRFGPRRADVEAIVEWFDKHGHSNDGHVSFGDWPVGMKGHFIARIPPAFEPGES